MQKTFQAGAVAVIGAIGFSVAALVFTGQPVLAGQSSIESDAGAVTETPTLAYRNEVEAAGRAWLEELGESGLVMEAGPLQAVYSAEPGKPLPAYITVSDGVWHITIGLSEKISSSMSAAEVQRRIDFFAHDGFPTPGLDKRHWRVRALTPSTHIEEGIDVLETGPGQLKLRVRTQFFALYGMDTRAVVPADAATPEEAYFQIEKAFPGEVVIILDLAGF